MQPIRWGIYGPGGIAATFTAAIGATPGARLVAVAGRTRAKADAFARQHDIPHVAADLKDLAGRGDVDVIYIATTHNVHCDAACTCLRAGKAVLCEKPLAMNATEVRTMIDTAREHNAFLMEALWTRFLPAWQRVHALLAEEAIGSPQMVQANFGFSGKLDPDGRMLNKQLAGGALLDLGIYPVSMAQWILPRPIRGIHAAAHIGSTGVDTRTAMTLQFEGDTIAQLSCAVDACSENRLTIAGTNGQIRIEAPFWAATRIEWASRGQSTYTETFPLRCNGFEEEIEAVHHCLLAGRLESSIMPHADSLAVAHILDGVRQQIRLQYPADQQPCQPCGSHPA